MQHTETYNLNIIETSDTFNPDALNANAQALDAALARLDAAAATIPKFVCGTYIGDGKTARTIELPFTPKLVYVGNEQGCPTYHSGSSVYYCGGMALEGKPAKNSYNTYVQIVEGGFQVFDIVKKEKSANNSDTEYRYFAIG